VNEIKAHKLEYDISTALAEFHSLCGEILKLDQDIVQNAILSLKQEHIRQKLKRKSLTEQEKKVITIWNAFKELYIQCRFSSIILKSSIQDGLAFDDIENNLVRNGDLVEQLFQLQKQYMQFIIPEYNDAILFDE
jgi:hypothetical protein